MMKPMLATLVDEPFDRAGWIFEIKWDGYRIQAETGPKVVLRSRNGKDYTARYAPIARALAKLRRRAVFDGEAVILDERGRPSFQRLADYGHAPEGRLVYVVFDILSLDGKDVRKLPLLERKRLLKDVLPSAPAIRYSHHVVARGKAFFRAAKKQGLEGIMAKDTESPYRSGIRGREWLKIKTHQRQEVVVAGFTEPRRSRGWIGALVVGVHERGKLIYLGHVGGGFDHAGLKAAYDKLKPLVRATSPFKEEIATNAPVHWVRPVLVCEVAFAGWTGEGHLRQPIFMGWRTDKPAKDVVRERARRV